MDRIEIKILNPEVALDAEKMMVATARLTQRGHSISCMSDIDTLLEQSYKQKTASNIAALPHPTLQKFGVINIAIVGASRRFLAQITRHQNEVKFMSCSLQYSDYSNAADFCVPYELITMDAEYKGHAFLEAGYYRRNYLSSCKQALAEYEAAIVNDVPQDAAGYMMPQGLRNVLIISATPFQLKHMISQRTCKRNTSETMYVMLRIWEELYPLSLIFQTKVGPSCIVDGRCPEGSMSCGDPFHNLTIAGYMREHIVSLPTAILDIAFKHIRG